MDFKILQPGNAGDDGWCEDPEFFGDFADMFGSMATNYQKEIGGNTQYDKTQQ